LFFGLLFIYDFFFAKERNFNYNKVSQKRN